MIPDLSTFRYSSLITTIRPERGDPPMSTPEDEHDESLEANFTDPRDEEDSTTEVPNREGASAAAYDLAQARFDLHENRSKIDKEELGKRYAWSILLISISTWIPVALLNIFQPHPAPLIWINSILAILTLAAAILAAWKTSKHNKKIAELWISRRKHRDAEKSARIRLSEAAIKSVLWNYHSDVAVAIEDYRSGAARHRRIGNWFQAFVIIASVGVSLLVTASGQFAQLQWTAVIISFLVASATSLNGYFKFRERGVNMQRAADDLEYEYNSAELAINNYRSAKDEVDRLKSFAERSERIKLDQRKREQQLEQAPQSRSSSGGESSN
jgi:membrane protease YdiL (CAAX protease family)